MPGIRCTVFACTNSRVKAKKFKNNEIRFYRFPYDEKFREIWVQRCGRGGKWNPDTCRVCSRHFTEDDYERDLKAELLNLPDKKKLKATAVPSLNLETDLGITNCYIKKEEPTNMQSIKRRNKSLVLDILESQESDKFDSGAILTVTPKKIKREPLFQNQHPRKRPGI